MSTFTRNRPQAELSPPRALPAALAKPYADIGPSSIRSAYIPTSPPGSPKIGFNVERNNMRSTGFSVQRGPSYPGSNSFGKSVGPPPIHVSVAPSQISPTRRNMYYAVAVGHTTGIFDTWAEAEMQIKDHPAPQWKTFKTKLAAESFVMATAPFPTSPPADAETGGYDMQLEYTTIPQASSSAKYQAPLHERLQKEFPPSTPKSAPSPPLNDLQPPRPPFARGSSSRSSSSSTPVKRSSPLRKEVTEEPQMVVDLGSSDSESYSDHSGVGAQGKEVKRKTFLSRISVGPSRPTSPQAAAISSQSSRFQSLDRQVLAPPIMLPPTDTNRTSSRATSHSGRPSTIRTMSSDAELAAEYEQRPASIKSVSTTSTSSRHGGPASPVVGLWGDINIPSSPPLSPNYPLHQGGSACGSDMESEGYASSSSAPKFSRSALKKSSVLLPISAKQAARSNRITSPTLSDVSSNGERSRAVSNASSKQNSTDRPGASKRHISSSSIHSINSNTSFKTAEEDTSQSHATNSPTIESSHLADQERLSPVQSNASSHGRSTSGEFSTRSDATHTQSEGCNTGKFADGRVGKKNSFRKLLRVLGFSKIDNSAWDRRLSA